MVRAAWPTETALCDAFAAEARSQGYRVHAECAGWDLLLVAPDGLQIGVEAKLRPSLEVLAQAMEERAEGPDIHAVLVPLIVYGSAFERVAKRLDLVVFRAWALLEEVPPAWKRRYGAAYGCNIAAMVERAPRWNHTAPAWTPPCEIPGHSGGRSAPIRITPWKVAAMALCRVLRSRGYLVRKDFRDQKVSPTWWVTSPAAPLRCIREGKAWRYVAAGTPLPDERWPEIARALAAQEDGCRVDP
jgi:hypothetical protein